MTIPRPGPYATSNYLSEPLRAEKRLVAEAFESFSFSSSGLSPSSTKYIIS